MTSEEDLHAQAVAELNSLRALASQMEESSKPSRAETQDALQRAFACLMSIEAELQRTTGDKSALIEQAKALQAALKRLRELNETGARSWRTQGFVLPVNELRSSLAGPRTRPPGRGSIGQALPGC
jgi:succinate dehydrogenase/fumarate reductase flavoprotein subunit